MSLYDSLGRHVGYNEIIKKIEIEIPDALYFFSAEAESIAIFNPLDEYRLSVVGTGEGNYTLNMKLTDETGAIVDKETIKGEVKSGETYNYSVKIIGNNLVVELPPSPVGGVWISINKFELLAPYIGLASFITIATISIAYIKYRKKKQT